MMKHVLFEEDGGFKAATILSATDAAFQVELASGKRTKVKSSHVLFGFDAPAPAQLPAQAQSAAADIDLDFLWECAPQEEFGFADLAREYYGRAPSALEQAAILFRLHGAPVYFHRKGRGRFRPAPADVLRAALAAVERKRQQELLQQQYIDELVAGRVPAPLASSAVLLLVRADKNSIEYRAVEKAAAQLQMSPLALLLARGAIASPHQWHVESFLTVVFPRGTDATPPIAALALALPEDLPLAPVPGFSIDDSATTEIDDAFSVQRGMQLGVAGNGTRIGIHIAAPALLLVRGDAIDEHARTRMSTVYAPGLKITMLPGSVIEAFSLNAGRVVPVLSLYVDLADDGAPAGFETRIECLRIATNLRHDELDERVTDETIAAGLADVPHGDDLVLLHRLARTLLAQREQVRGRPEPLNRVDYTFVVSGEGDAQRVAIHPRRRGAPLDLIVAELMILANSHWGGWLVQGKRAGIYRSQSSDRNGARSGERSFSAAAGRVRMSTTPAPHDGIGVKQYAWSTSPLRRYVDLVNQRQLIAAARGLTAPYAANDSELLAIVSAFETAYGAYAEFQERLERYWCLRWLQQERVTHIGATVLREEVVRLDHLPLVQRLAGAPALVRGQRIELDVLAIDLVALNVQLRLRDVLSSRADESELDEDEDAAAVDVMAEAAAIATAAVTADVAADTAAEPAVDVPADNGAAARLPTAAPAAGADAPPPNR